MKFVIRRAFFGAMLVASGSSIVYWSYGLYDWKAPADKSDSVVIGLLSSFLIAIGLYSVFVGTIINMPRTFKKLRRFVNKTS